MCSQRKKRLYKSVVTNRAAKPNLYQGDLYEPPPFFHKRALPITSILRKREKLSENAGLLGRNVGSVSRELRKNCTQQKGTKENLNGLLREFYPKGRNLSRVSPATLKKNLALLNARHEKVLHFKTPQDLFPKNLIRCCT